MAPLSGWVAALCSRFAAQNVRSDRRGAELSNLGKDVRYSVRLLSRNPGFTAAAILTLAVGIGIAAQLRLTGGLSGCKNPV
jgi:hypothetical protein